MPVPTAAACDDSSGDKIPLVQGDMSRRYMTNGVMRGKIRWFHHNLSDRYWPAVLATNRRPGSTSRPSRSAARRRALRCVDVPDGSSKTPLAVGLKPKNVDVFPLLLSRFPLAGRC